MIMDFSLVNAFEYAGQAWCKLFALSDLTPRRPQSQFGQAVLQAQKSWLQGPDAHTALKFVEMLVEDQLALYMPESSSWGELQKGTWEPTSADALKATLHVLVDAMGCEQALTALPLFCLFLDYEAMYTFSLKGNYQALAAVGQNHCMIFFDSDT